MGNSSKFFLGFLAATAIVIGTISEVITGLKTIIQEGGNLVPILLNIAYQIGKLEFFMIIGTLIALIFIFALSFTLFLLRIFLSVNVRLALPNFAKLSILGVGSVVGIHSFFYPNVLAIHSLIGLNYQQMRGLENYYSLFGFITLFLTLLATYRHFSFTNKL